MLNCEINTLIEAATQLNTVLDAFTDAAHVQEGGEEMRKGGGRAI